MQVASHLLCRASCKHRWFFVSLRCLDDCESLKFEYTFDSVLIDVQKECLDLDLQALAYSRISSVEDKAHWKMKRYPMQSYK